MLASRLRYRFPPSRQSRATWQFGIGHGESRSAGNCEGWRARAGRSADEDQRLGKWDPRSHELLPKSEQWDLTSPLLTPPLDTVLYWADGATHSAVVTGMRG